MNSFKEAFDLAKRREIYQKESYLHPNKVAVVIEVHPKSKLALNRYFKYTL